MLRDIARMVKEKKTNFIEGIRGADFIELRDERLEDSLPTSSNI